MDLISKTLVAATSLVGLLVGFVMALRKLISETRKLRKEISKPKPAKSKGATHGHSGKPISKHKESLVSNDRPHPKGSSDFDVDEISSIESGDWESTDDAHESVVLQRPPLFTRLFRSRTFVVGLLLFILGAAGLAYLYHRATALSVRISRPASGKLDVKSDGKGSGLFSVAGDYGGGDLSASLLGIYVLVRSEEAGKNAPWYVQGPAYIDTEDTWYRKGEWSLEEASVGRGQDAPLKPGEKWEIVAVFASIGLPNGSTITPAQLKETAKWGAESEISHVTVGDIAPADAQPDTR